MTVEISPLSGELKTIFETEQGLTEYALRHSINLENIEIKDYDISKTTLMTGVFNNTHWEDVVYQFATISNVHFNSGSLTDVSFSKSTLTNVTFENMQIDNANFIGATLIDVTFKSCQIINSEIRNLRNSKIIFEASELEEVSFFDSELHITLKNTKIIESCSFLGLKAGSQVSLIDSYIGPYTEFDNSTLSSFSAKNSTIIDAKMNFSTVDNITIENSDLDFPMATGKFNNVRLTNITSAINLSRSTINSLTIEDCDSEVDIQLYNTVFKKISIRNCAVNEIDISDAKGERIQLSQIQIGNANFSTVTVKELILTDITIVDNANFQGALADESQITNFKIKSGSKVNMVGTNIKL